MKRLLRSKLALSLTAFIMLAASIVIPLSGSITHSHAASRTSHNIAYVNYDDSGFTGFSANIFSTSIIGGPAQTSSATASVTYNGMTFTPLTKAAISSTTLATYDTLILFEVCDIATSLSSSQHDAINAYLAAGNKIILFDGDRCAPGFGGAGNADYSWFTFPFATSNPGPQGASGTLTIVENSTLTNGLSTDPFNLDELGDANTAITSDPHWFAAAKTTNALGNNGYFLAYARNSGLIIYDGADHWATDGPTKSLTDLFLNELNQQYDPDNLPGTVPIASPTPSLTPTPPPTKKNLVILLQGIDSSFPTTDPNLAQVGITLKGLPSFTPATTQFVNYSYSGSDPKTGAPLPYACTSTFTNTILRDILRLNDQIKRAAAHFGSTNIYLVGHSLGGVVAFGYMALLEEHVNGVTLPAGAKLKAVVTLDSPIGGVAGAAYILFSKVVATTPLGIPGYPCAGLNLLTSFRTFDDLVRIYDSPTTNGGTTPSSDPGADPQGAKASIFAIAGVTNPTPNLPFLPSNDFVAGLAHSDLGTAILTIGDTRDFLWNPNAPSCEAVYAGVSSLLAAIALTIPDFRGTQFLEDQGDNSGHFGRSFDSNNPCILAFANTFNHLDVLKVANVQKGLRHFFATLGQTPTPLKVNPFQS